SLARIHRANLVNFGILPLLFVRPEDYDSIPAGAAVTIPAATLTPGGEVPLRVRGVGDIAARNDLSPKELEIIRAGGLLNYVRN
ncbi:MAG: aconitate hydratase, partial [Desulfovibrionaceae bacterium]|nr:aconitate hydratase [Desulfovibrionaceae bacterium]